MDFLRSKAVFMAFILVFSVFSISLLNIGEVVAENTVCCEKLSGSDDFCVSAEESRCDLNFNKASTSCESTNFCQVGCCYSLEEGMCSQNTPKSVCDNIGGVFSDDPSCSIPQCQNGCCQLPGQCSFVSYAECRASVGAYASLNFQDVFDSSVQDELTCSNQCRSGEEGCCITEEGAEFVTRTECVDIGGSFNLNMLCSNPTLGTGCTKEHHTDCLLDEEEVYWFDSCGNRENVYDESKIYTGFIQEPSIGDGTGNARNVENGNCDYVQSSICGEADDDFLRALRTAGKDTSRIKHMCVDLTCNTEDLFKPDTIAFDSAFWRLNQDKQNGESWCVYDGAVGEGKDIVGSRHYRHICLNGEEVFEECAADRSEICVQNDIELETIGEDSTREITGALCRPNRGQQCLQLNDVDYSYNSCSNAGKSGGVSCDEEGNVCKIYKDAGKNKEYEECCVEQCNRETKCEEFPSDCYWHEGLGVCAPNVPTSSTDFCDQGTVECKQVWVKGGTFTDWSVQYGKDCNTANWAANANNFCRSLGDCGAHYNLEGEISMDGFSFTGPDEDVRDFWHGGGDVVSRDAQEFIEEKLGNFNSDFKKSAEPLMGQDIFGLWALSLALAKYDQNPPEEWWMNWKTKWGAYGVVATAITGLSLSSGVGVWASIWEGLSLTIGGPGIFGTLGSITSISGVGSVVAEGLTFTAASDIVAGGGGAGTVSTGGTGAALGSVLSWLAIIAVAALALYFIHTLGYDTKTITYTATCNPWVAPTGGDDCDKCKDEFKICDEYRCSSLGQSCELINEGTENQDCVALNVNDASPPVIDLLPLAPKRQSDFTETVEGYAFNENINVYTSVDIGISTNEPAQCRITKNPREEFDDISEYFGTTLYLENHTMTINVASEALNENSVDIFGGGQYDYYVRCEDKNGNRNRAGYYIRFNVNDEPDRQPPVIESMSLNDGTPIAYGAQETELLLELNEPSFCRFAKEDLEYDLMSGEIECSESSGSNPYRYPCKMTLTGIEDNKLNDYYIRCKDKALPEPNVNQESKLLSLRGTEPLEISSMGPTGTLYTFNVELNLQTSKGANEGESTCYYSDDENINLVNGNEFFNTGSNIHTQPLTLGNGNYDYHFLCVDEAGNQDKGNITFTVDTPEINIVDIEPRNGSVIRETTFEITAITEGRAEDANVECDYAVGDLSGTLFFEEQEGSILHTREIEGLSTGSYTLNIDCTDGYKETNGYTNFRVDITTGPTLMRVYTTNVLNILLNQEAICEYSDEEFIFGEGNLMVPEGNSREKSAALGQDIYHILCRNDLELEGSFIIYP